MKRVKLRYYINPQTGEPHIYDHDVTEEEVEEILRSTRSGEDRPGRRNSRLAIGQTFAGRYLRVVYSPDPKPGHAFVITAYELTDKAISAYRRRQRRRKK